MVPSVYDERPHGHRGGLVDHRKRRLATYEASRGIEIVNELPNTTSGKIPRRELRDRARQSALVGKGTE
jgi:acyl-coenzyme A synthetase/AMP-(fatty) acid ligase